MAQDIPQTVALDRPGVFNAQVIDATMFNPEGKRSTSFQPYFLILEKHNKETGEWDDWEEFQMGITGDQWVIGKEGNGNERAINTCIALFDWDPADLWEGLIAASIGKVVSITVEWEEYNGKNSLKVKWMNPKDSTGSGAGKMSEEKLSALQNEHANILLGFALPKPPPPAAGKPGRKAPPPPKADPANYLEEDDKIPM
jgi:hypothetical protein